MFVYLVAALLGAEPAAGAAIAPPPAHTLQAQFDSATAAHDAGRFDESVKAFEALEQRPAVQRNPAVLGTLLLRKGSDLVALRRVDDAEKALRAALNIVPRDRPDLNLEIAIGLRDLGNIEMLHLNYAAATENYQEALALSDKPGVRLSLLAALAQSTMFDPGDAALTYIDQAQKLLESQPGKRDKNQVAALQTYHARILLNRGRFGEAYALLKKALAAQGGLVLKVSISDVVTRSDLAISALLAGSPDAAREYLAYTGAGRLERAPFRSAANMEPPPCGGPANLQPTDVAVIEFSIRADGTVGAATPIYASSPGPAAFEFARAVLGWSWRPEDVVDIPEFYRLITRVELRCSNSVPRPNVIDLLSPGFARWLDEKHARPAPHLTNDSADHASLKAELARREADGNAVMAIPLLFSLARNPVGSLIERQGWLLQARDIAAAASAPISVTAYLEILAAGLDPQWEAGGTARYRATLRELLLRQSVTEDATMSGSIKLMLADSQFRGKPPADAEALLQSVADDSRLSANSPLRVGALIRLSALLASNGNLALAYATYRKTGIDAQQCPLLDAPPVMRRTNAGSSDFPMEALSWGFEGWVRTEYDINANGKTAAQRAVIAYPPFVFRDAAVDMAKDFVYEKRFRPDGGTGCSGQQKNINFQIPANH